MQLNDADFLCFDLGSRKPGCSLQSKSRYQSLLIVELMLWFKASACVFGLRAGFPCFKCEYDQYFLGC